MPCRFQTFAFEECVRPGARLVLIDVAALLLVAVGVCDVFVRVAKFRLGFIDADALITPAAALLLGLGAAVVFATRQQWLRAYLRSREDRKIVATAAGLLAASALVIGLAAVSIMGERWREETTARISSASTSLAVGIDNAIRQQVAAVKVIATQLLPQSNLLAAAIPGGSGALGPHAGTESYADAIADLGARDWQIRDETGRVLLHSGRDARGAPALALDLSSTTRAWIVQDSVDRSLDLRLVVPIRVRDQRLGEFRVTLPLRAEAIFARLVPGLERGELLLCRSEVGASQCLTNVPIRSLHTIDRAVTRASEAGRARRVVPDVHFGRLHLTAYSPVSDTGVGLALRVSANDLYASLLLTAREVSLLLALLLAASLILLVWQVRPVARRLQRSEAQLRSALEYSGLGVLIFEPTGRITLANAAAGQMLGYDPGELVALPGVLELVDPGQRELARLALHDAFDGGEHGAYCAQRTYVRRDGSRMTVRLHVSPIPNEHGEADLAIAYLQDVGELLRSADALRREHAFILALLAQLNDGVIACDEFGELRYVNQAATHHLGVSMSLVTTGNAVHLDSLRHLDMSKLDESEQPLGVALRGHETPQSEMRAVHGGLDLHLQVISQPLRDAEGRRIGAVLVSHDLTEIRSSQKRLEWLAGHDTLTGLPNRSTFLRRVTDYVTKHAAEPPSFAIAYLDLDRFKAINETLGHRVGDALLREVAGRWSRVLGGDDNIARLGGDDFVVLLESAADGRDAVLQTEQMLRELSLPAMLDEHVVYTSASAGIVLYPHDGTDIDALLKRADTALADAKQHARGGWRLFDHAGSVQVERRLNLENALRTAVAGAEFELHFQPKVDMRSGLMIGAEALLRWIRPGQPSVPPSEFIPVLEDLGLIPIVGEWALRSVCELQARWLADGLRIVQVAVNCSSKQFHGASLAELVHDLLARSGIPAAMLAIEITESVLMHDPQHVNDTLHALLAMGVECAIDDFGMGYSSLAYLKRLSATTLKIDREFVKDLPGDAEDVAIARAILALARALDMHTIAEGVEHAQQLHFLAEHGCDAYQGFYFSKPLPAAEFAKLLRSSN